VDSLQCPGCGAAVRPKESWCSLCYRDLRPAEQIVSAAPAQQVDGASLSETGPIKQNLIKTNLLEVHVEPAELSAVIPRPASAAEGESLPEGEPAKSWPCTCGEHVAIDRDFCPTCGRTFLNELRGLEAPGKTGPQWLSSYLEASRAMRLAIAGGIAAVIALGIPGLLALFD
jgi:predicted amidophosphoribosyltransferase